ncbi:hypothetical protein [Aureliella helgolandensis]|uniref:Uncharacterized protein n=1 Tax=Aureliella helgolandensis TaxID=2527968 RepID=A0A518GD01_9BACT|nr:hypothetical protein [Aureliella helgolandensis]QDV26474.1 hypothetical protein Q31a_48480 [Aureliella helgolandensis]
MNEPIREALEPNVLRPLHWIGGWLQLSYTHAKPVLTIAILCFAFWLLHHEFQSTRWTDVSNCFRSLPAWTVLAALLLTAVNFAVLTGYDWLGLQLVQHLSPPYLWRAL